MMDSYIGYDGGDISGEKERLYFDRIPSPDNWSTWGVCGFGHPAYGKMMMMSDVSDDGGGKMMMMSDVSDERRPRQLDGEGCYGCSSQLGSSSQDSRPWNLQIDGFTGTQSMDAMFLSSLILNDVPETAHNCYPINLPSQSSVPALMLAHGGSDGTMLDSQNMHCGTDNPTDFQSRPFCTSAGSNSGRSCEPNVGHCNSLDQSHIQSTEARKTTGMVLSDQAAGCEDSLTEESVLLGLEAVLTQLSSQTRLCVRDSLYRLAQCSEPSTSADVSPECSSLDRTTITTTGESETNRIDRAVANLMFQNPNGERRCA